MLAALGVYLLGTAGNAQAAEDKPNVFSDGSRPAIRRVFTYKQEDGVPVFTDKVPHNQRYEVMEFACYACDPASKVDWNSIALHNDKYTDLIDGAAKRYGVDAALIRAVIHAESGFNPYARSKKGAAGLMQLMPTTALEMKVTNVDDVKANITGGVKYLAKLLDQYKGNVTLATAAYNAGPDSVNRYGTVPPFAETQTYVERVKILHKRYKALG